MLDSAVTGGPGTVIEGTLSGAADHTCRIEHFVSPECDTGGQGETFLGAVDVVTDSAGAGAFTFATPVDVTPGYSATATATPYPLAPTLGENINTTAYSSCRELVASGPALGPDLVIPEHVTAAAGAPAVVPVTFTANGNAIGPSPFRSTSEPA